MKKSLFITASALVVMSAAASAQVVPVNYVPRVIPQLITIRKQDIDSGERIRQEKQELRDFKNRKETRKKIIKELKKRRGELIKHVEVPKYQFKNAYIEEIEVAESLLIPISVRSQVPEI